MTPPNNGQRNNQPILIHPPLPVASHSIPSMYSANQRQPGADYVANNLQQILASLTSDDRLGTQSSMMYRPPQEYVTPPPVAYRPAPYPTVKPQTWSSGILGNRQPGAITPISVQASVRQQMNTNRQPGVDIPILAQASLRHNTPARMPQANTVGIQRAPLRQGVTGKLQPFSILQAQIGFSRQNQNQGLKTLQPHVLPDRVNSYEQIQSPIVWHIPLGNPKNGVPGGFQKPFFSSIPMRPTPLTSLGQKNVLQNTPVRNRTTGSVQKPYVASFRQPYLNQPPFAQRQRVDMLQPLQIQNNMSPPPGGPRAQVATTLQQQQLQQQQKQNSLAYKMALLGESNQVPQTSVPAPSLQHVPSTQTAAFIQKQLTAIRPSSTNFYLTSPYSPNAQRKVQTPTARVQSKTVFPPGTQHLRQGIPQMQVSPFNPHYIYGQHSWPWGSWTNRASPIALTSSRSSSFPRPQAYDTNARRYQTPAGITPKLPVSPYAVSPKVLLYYYFYPRTITKPLMKLTNLKGDELKGSFWQKLREQIASAASNRKPEVATLATNPTVTGQTQGKSTVTQTGPLQSNISPFGAFKQLVQIPYNAPYGRLVAGPSKGPLSRNTVAGRLANQLQVRKKVHAPLLQTPLGMGMRQMTYLPFLKQQSAWTSPNVAQQIKSMTQQQTVNAQLPVLGDRKSQLTNGLLNRPIYVQTVPYQLYYLLQQLPLLNTQSGTQRYLSRVLNDILRLRYVKHKKKKKKRGLRNDKSRLVNGNYSSHKL